MSEDKVKRLAEIKSYLENRLKSIEEELELLRTLLRMVDEALARESFTSASALMERERAEVVGERASMEFDVRSRTGEKIAHVEVYSNRLVVRPEVTLHVNTPPFKAFLINKILEGFKKKDERRVHEGELTEDQVIRYEVKEEGGVLKELVIYNYGDRQRLFELRGVIRWTLNRMYEKEYS